MYTYIYIYVCNTNGMYVLCVVLLSYTVRDVLMYYARNSISYTMHYILCADFKRSDTAPTK